MPKLYIPVGIPGCGKSTWCKSVLNARIISTDVIRQYLCPDGYDASKNTEVFEVFHSLIQAALAKENDVVADATNLSTGSRASLYKIAEQYNAEAHVFFFTNIQQAIKRNAARPVDGKAGEQAVPYDAMLGKMLPQYEVAWAIIDSEPYDTLTRIEGVNL